jgi:1-acyl-sn-glycerol-3-phosphate acyltransferase
MLYLISKLVLWLAGWKIVGRFPKDLKKCIVVMAPHTSMMDFIWGRLAYWVLRVKVKFLIKKESFETYYGGLVKWAGGIPVDRKNSSNMVETIAKMFSQTDSLFITITPEGTRKLNPNWKKGFYYIALKAKVPIALGFLDYDKKEGGVGPIITPSGNFEEDFKKIEEFYRGMKGKHPEFFNL